MTLLDSLLDAIVRLDGDSLVMHVGEKPYVVTTSSAMSALRGPLSWGQVELSSRPLTADAVLGMLGQILPLEQRHMLDDIGAIEHELASNIPGVPAFILTAARGGDDVWVEVRRKVEPPAVVEAEPAPVEVAAEAPASEPEVAAPVEVPAVETPEPEMVPVAVEEPVIAAAEETEPVIASVEEPEPAIVAVEEEEPAIVAVEEDAPAIAAEDEQPAIAAEPEPVIAAAEEPEPVPAEIEEPVFVEAPAFEIVAEEPQVEVSAEDVQAIEMPAGFEWVPEEPQLAEEPEIVLNFDEPEQVVQFDLPAREVEVPAVAEEPAIEIDVPVVEIAAEEPVLEIAADEPEIPSIVEEPEPVAAEPTPVVVPIAKPTLKLTPPPAVPAAPAASTEATLVGLLKAAASRGASTLYAVADARPMVRIDGEVTVLGVEASVTAAEVDRFTFEFAPRDRVAEPASEWTCAIKGVGRVRCVTFHDDSGTGLIFHLPSADVSTADELGLSARIQALCGEADGLVVIAGPRGSGKSTLLDAFVDLINRTRNDHVITIESHIRTAHEKRHSFISQRQSAPDGEAIAAAARAALREGPDVLVIEDLRAPEALSVALDASRAGRLVFGGIAAPTASAAVERLVGAFRGDRRPQVRALLAGSLRAVIAQTLVRKQTGGRIAARELLLNSTAVEKLILDGAFAQLPIAIDGGRQLGMITMNDALGALVRDGAVDVNDACRAAPDRASLIAALERDGIDVSHVERWA